MLSTSYVPYVWPNLLHVKILVYINDIRTCWLRDHRLQSWVALLDLDGAVVYLKSKEIRLVRKLGMNPWLVYSVVAPNRRLCYCRNFSQLCKVARVRLLYASAQFYNANTAAISKYLAGKVQVVKLLYIKTMSSAVQQLILGNRSLKN